MGFAKAACSQSSMVGNGKVGKNRDLERIVYGAGGGKAGDYIGIHDYLWYKDKGS
jgi:hypothetical protein